MMHFWLVLLTGNKNSSSHSSSHLVFRTLLTHTLKSIFVLQENNKDATYYFTRHGYGTYKYIVVF